MHDLQPCFAETATFFKESEIAFDDDPERPSQTIHEAVSRAPKFSLLKYEG
jgi:hypothetical protein